MFMLNVDVFCIYTLKFNLPLPWFTCEAQSPDLRI